MSKNPVRRRRAREWITLLVASATAVPLALPAQDTIRVEPDALGLWGDTLRAVEELRIGSVQGDSASTFGLVTDLAVADDGTIWVIDYQVPVIRRYDRLGTFMGDVGREGEGPGEYRRPIELEFADTGRMALWDFGNRRITVYEPDGTFVDSHPVPTNTLYARRMFWTSTAGDFYVWTDLGPMGPPLDDALLRVSTRAGTAVDTIDLPDRNPGDAYQFRRETLSAVTTTGNLVIGRNDTYSFTIRRNDAPSVTVLRPSDLIPLASEEREQWQARAEWRRRREERAGAAAAIGDIPETKPAFQSLNVDQVGRIWVSRHVRAVDRGEAEAGESDAPAITWRERPTFDVYRPNGTFLGTAVLPFGARWTVSRGKKLWGTERGTYDEPYVVRYRLVERRRD